MGSKPTASLIDALIQVLSSTTPGGSDLWPLKPAQLFPYLDVDQTLFLYGRLKELEQRKVSLKKIATAIQHPTVLRHYLANVGLTGLKIAEKLKLPDSDVANREHFATYLLRLLEEMTPEDPICEHGTNKVLPESEVNKLMRTGDWQPIDDFQRRAINGLGVSLITLCWTYYWPYFPSAGYEAYGPYPVYKGTKGILVIKDFFNLKPGDVWPASKKSDIEKITICQIFKTSDIFLTFSNRILSSTNLASLYDLAVVTVNGKQISDSKQLEDVAAKLDSLSQEQTAVVNRLSDRDKVRFGARLSSYTLKNFYDTFWNNWHDERRVEKTLSRLGDKFLKSGADQKDRTPEELAQLFDPRNDFIP